jgi:hypothetical protein
MQACRTIVVLVGLFASTVVTQEQATHPTWSFAGQSLPIRIRLVRATTRVMATLSNRKHILTDGSERNQ